MQRNAADGLFTKSSKLNLDNIIRTYFYTEFTGNTLIFVEGNLQAILIPV